MITPAISTPPHAPVTVHLVFHPASEGSSVLAEGLRAALNGDGQSIGQRVPVLRLRPTESPQPPEEGLVLSGSAVELVVVLADDHMVVDHWGAFISELSGQCLTGGARFLPLQMSTAAFPLHPSLAQTRFLPVFDAQGVVDPALAERAVVSELCRMAIAHETRTTADVAAAPPIRLFLSHAKQDIDVVPRVLHEILHHLNETQPVQVWVDSAMIIVGSNFATAIEDGIRECAVLVLGTSSYSSRAWCRREVLLAKKHRRPVIVVRAAVGAEHRSFPYVGNVPVLSWTDGAARRAVDLMLAETLRMTHARLLLMPLARPGEQVFPTPPELVTVNDLPAGTSVLYPDPPLGDEEAELLDRRGLTLRTPLQSIMQQAALDGVRIALSISPSDSLPVAGVFAKQMDPWFVEISRYLLLLGATLVYGGHLGSDGYTQTLFDLVRAHNGQGAFGRVKSIVNYVGWPLPNAGLPVSRLASIADVAELVRVARPPDLDGLDPPFDDEPASLECNSARNRYAWARGMTAMRERVTAETRARILMGGRASGNYLGRMAGVVEEALLSVRARKPMYVCGVFGGAAQDVAMLLLGHTPPHFTWAAQSAVSYSEGMRRWYVDRGMHFDDYPQMAAEFAAYGVAELSRDNGLTEAENCELFAARDVSRIVALILSGLSKVPS